jgi:hypothetical protein
VERVVKVLVVGLSLLLAAIHLRLMQQERSARGVTVISTAPELRKVTHDVFRREGSLDHALTLNFAIDLREQTVIDLAREIRITGGPIAVDVLDRPVPLSVNATGNKIAFAPPPPAFGALRQVTIAFTTAMPKPTYGWSYRAVAVPWAATLAPATIVQSHVNGATSAPGWRCGEDETGRVCAIDVRRRRSLALPIERVDDSRAKLLLGLVVGVTISVLMVAIYRRWSAHAERMGMPDEAPTIEEWVAEQRRATARRASRSSVDEIDPLEAVALIARGITAVLGLLASVFLVSHFEGGFFPMLAPLALSIWCAVAGITIVTAVGFATPRPWAAFALLCFAMMIALIPAARFILPGVPPLFAAVAMQLTQGKAKQR